MLRILFGQQKNQDILVRIIVQGPQDSHLQKI